MLEAELDDLNILCYLYYQKKMQLSNKYTSQITDMLTILNNQSLNVTFTLTLESQIKIDEFCSLTTETFY